MVMRVYLLKYIFMTIVAMTTIVIKNKEGG